MPRCGVPARVQRAEQGMPTVLITPKIAPLNTARTAQARHPYPATVRAPFVTYFSLAYRLAGAIFHPARTPRVRMFILAEKRS
jgi:hypothetical protein